MFNWQQIKVLIVAAMLTGCSTTPIAVDLPKYHPQLPEPYATCEHVEWEYIITETNNARPSLSYQDGLDLSKCRDDMIRYLREMEKIVSYYRTNL